MINSHQHKVAKLKATNTYNAAADYFDHPVSSFWHCFGRKTVEQLSLKAGDRVLDVCSGSGGSAIPAAQLVGATGQVIAVDLAEQLIALAKAKAKQNQLENIEFHTADMLELGYPDQQFDAVICVFGIFFVPDMPAAVRELWRMVKPGGYLAITTWGQNLFEPANSIFWDAINTVRPDLQGGFKPWERIADTAGLKAMLAEAGVDTDQISHQSGSHPLHDPEDWWKIAMGSGYRGTLDQLDSLEFEQVFKINMAQLQQAGINAIATNVIYSLAQKPLP